MLIVAIILLFSFVTLFIGAGISRVNLRKELVAMKENTAKRNVDKSRLTVIEAKNNTLNFIIGRSEKTERLISALK